MDRKTLIEAIEEAYLALIRSFYFDYKEQKYTMDITKALPKMREQFPKAKIIKWINEGSDFVVRLGKCLYAEAKVTVPAKDYWFFIWDSGLDIIAAYWNGIKLSSKTQDEIDECEDYINVDWENATDNFDTPTKYINFTRQKGHGAGHSIKLVPKNELEGLFKIRCLRLPTKLVNDDDKVALEGSWYDAVISYIVNKATGNISAMKKLAGQIEVMSLEADDRDRDRVKRIRDTEGDTHWKK